MVSNETGAEMVRDLSVHRNRQKWASRYSDAILVGEAVAQTLTLHDHVGFR